MMAIEHPLAARFSPLAEASVERAFRIMAAGLAAHVASADDLEPRGPADRGQVRR
jgi:hypothetical protein